MRVATIALVSAVFAASSAQAVTFKWVPANTPQPGTYAWFDANTWDANGIPTDGVGNIADAEEGNNNITIDINNGGNDISLANSTIILGRGNYIDSVGGDDEIFGDTIQMNGAGGAAPVMDVAVTANAMTSNRHGAVFNVSPTIGSINSQGIHQQKWIFNASPTAPITSIRMADTDSRGSNHDDNFTANVNMQTLAFDLEWGRITVGTGATFDVGDLQITFDDDWALGNNVYNQIILNGDMLAASLTFENINVANEITLVPQTNGTYGSVGTAASVDFEVSWLTGDGVLTVGGAPAIPGDTDGDGDIDDADLGTSFANYTGPVGAAGGKTAAEGDTDGDGDVDDSDLGTSFSGYTGPLGPASVPEPTSLALIGLGGLALIRRRRA